MASGRRDEPLEERQSILAAVQGNRRFVPDDVGRELDAGRDVGRIRDDDVEAGSDGIEQIAAHEADAVGDAVTRDVAPRHRERRVRHVGRDHEGCRELGGERHSEAPAAGTDVEDAGGAAPAPFIAHRFDDEFGFGAGNEDVVGELEVEAPELLAAGDERNRLAAGAPSDEGVEARREVFGGCAASVRQQAGPIPSERVTRQYFGVDRGGVGIQPGAGQRLAGRRNALVDGQWDGSDW